MLHICSWFPPEQWCRKISPTAQLWSQQLFLMPLKTKLLLASWNKVWWDKDDRKQQNRHSLAWRGRDSWPYTVASHQRALNLVSRVRLWITSVIYFVSQTSKITQLDVWTRFRWPQHHRWKNRRTWERGQSDYRLVLLRQRPQPTAVISTYHESLCVITLFHSCLHS